MTTEERVARIETDINEMLVDISRIKQLVIENQGNIITNDNDIVALRHKFAELLKKLDGCKGCA